jgi:hypothetical protein
MKLNVDIVAVHEGVGVTLVDGTPVLVDGKPMYGVTSIEIIGESGNVWRAVIHCLPRSIKIGTTDSKFFEHVDAVDHEFPPGGSSR